MPVDPEPDFQVMASGLKMDIRSPPLDGGGEGLRHQIHRLARHPMVFQMREIALETTFIKGDAFLVIAIGANIEGGTHIHKARDPQT